jgi:hypothetical protein
LIDAILDSVNKGGPIVQAIAACAAAGGLFLLILLLALVAGARSSLVRRVSMVCLLSSAGIALSGAYGAWTGKQAADAAASTLRPGKAERTRREAYLGLRANAARALELAGAPWLFGLIGMRAASRRRWAEDHDSPPPGLGLPVLLVLAALVGSGANAYCLLAPVAGRSLDETAWRVIDLRDALDFGDWEACFTPDLKIPPGSPALAMGELKDNQHRCAHHFLSADPVRVEHLQRLLDTPWFEDPEVRKGLKEKIDAAAPPKPSPPPADPALKEAQEAARGCLEKSGKKAPKLAPEAHLRVEVSAAGKALSVQEVSSGRLPPATQKCFVSELKKLGFAAGPERWVEVPLTKP